MNRFLEVLVVQAYWLALLPVGYALLRIGLRVAPRAVEQWAEAFLDRQSGIAKGLVGFAAANVIFALFSFFFYVVRAPAVYAETLYLAMLFLAAGYFIGHGPRNLLEAKRRRLAWLRRTSVQTKVAVVLLGVLLVFDYAFSLRVGAYAHGDAIFHMSRVMSIVNNGFNVNSSFMSNVPESAYHYNVVYALYAAASKLIHLEPTIVWRYSLAFFRLMLYAIFGLFLAYIYKNWFNLKLPQASFVALGVIAVVATMSGTFFTASYPNVVVYIWIVLYVIVLDVFAEPNARQAALLALLGVVVAMTHPTYALALAGFTCYVLALELLGRKITLRQAANFLLPVAILMTAPLYSRLIATKFTAYQLHIKDPLMVHWGLVSFINPWGDRPHEVVGWILLIAGAIATLGLVIRLWGTRHWSLVVAFVTYYPLLAYTPVFGMVHRFMPAWVIQRFAYLNLLVYVSIPLAVLFCLDLVWRQKRGYQLAATTTILVVCAVAIVPAYQDFGSHHVFNYSIYKYDEIVWAHYKQVFTNRKVVLTTRDDSYLLAGAFPIDVIAVAEGHSPTSADTSNRIKCQNHLFEDYAYRDLRSARVDYVAVPAENEGYWQHERDLAASKPYLHFVGEGPWYEVFGVDIKYAAGSSAGFAACNYLATEK